MRRPKQEVVGFIIREILNSRPVGSQEELSGLVRAELKRGGADLAITGKRLRMIAVKTPGVGVSVSLRNGKIPSRCPCCFSWIKKNYTRNLKGRKILVGLKCRKCSYKGSENKWVPRRYEFKI